MKDKGADMAEGALQAVKSRPKAVSLALGAFAVFLARGAAEARGDAAYFRRRRQRWKR